MADRSYGWLVYPLYHLGATSFPNPYDQVVSMSKKSSAPWFQ
jgi:hypothetical protein